MSNRSSGAIAIVVAAFLWSLDGFLRRQLFSLPPTVVVMWEHLLGLIVLAPLVLPRWKEFKKLSRRQWISITLVALFSGALGTIAYTAALGKVHFIQFSVVVLLQQLQPIFAIVAARVVLKEPISKRFTILAGVALVAAYFVSFPHLVVNAHNDPGTIIAAALALAAAACWGSSTAFSKYTLRHTSSMHVTALRFAIAPIFALALAILLGQTASLGTISTLQWKYLIGITFSTGLVALAIYYHGLQRVLASRSTILELTWPVSSVLVGYFFLGERLTITQWLGAIVLVAVMTMIARNSRDNSLNLE